MYVLGGDILKETYHMKYNIFFVMVLLISACIVIPQQEFVKKRVPKESRSDIMAGMANVTVDIMQGSALIRKAIADIDADMLTIAVAMINQEYATKDCVEDLAKRRNQLQEIQQKKDQALQAVLQAQSIIKQLK